MSCSPCLKLKPVSKSIKSGYLTVNVETYGGGLWHTWFDRDLSVAGRVLVKQGGQLQHKLVSLLLLAILSQHHEGLATVWYLSACSHAKLKGRCLSCMRPCFVCCLPQA